MSRIALPLLHVEAHADGSGLILARRPRDLPGVAVQLDACRNMDRLEKEVSAIFCICLQPKYHLLPRNGVDWI